MKAHYSAVSSCKLSYIEWIDKQGPTVQHRELYSIFCEKLMERNMKSSIYKWTSLVAQMAKNACNTGVLSHLVVTLWDPVDCCPQGSSVLGDSPGRNIRVGCCALLQGIFPPRDQTQVSRTAGEFFIIWAIREAQLGNLCRRPGFNHWVGKIPCRRKWPSTLICLLGEFHGQKTLADYSPWDHKELDMTKGLTHRHAYICITKSLCCTVEINTIL